jgi:hypothetical protein
VIQHDNFYKYYNTNDIKKELPIETVRPYYLHKDYKEVIMSHSMIHVKDEQFMLDQDFLLIDLGKPTKEQKD